MPGGRDDETMLRPININDGDQPPGARGAVYEDELVPPPSSGQGLSPNATPRDAGAAARKSRPSRMARMFRRRRLFTEQRILDREAPFSQSFGKFNIDRYGTDLSLRWAAWYHTMVSWPLHRITLVFAAVVISSWLVLALLLWGVSANCGLEVESYGQAVMLAIITMSTIGYGVEGSPYLGGCGSGIVVIGAFAMWGLVLDALVIGVIMQRIARGQRRASTVCFSDKAVVRIIGGQAYFIFQVCEMRKHQLIEAHVRLYCIRRSATPGSADPIPFQSHTMRLQQPDDELGGMLLLAMPQQVIHRIDPWSPLMPRDEGFPPDHRFHLSTRYTYPGVLQRQVDLETGNREGREKANNFEDIRDVPAPPADALRAWMKEASAEVLVLVEGIDAVTSYTVQARHSYTVDDCVFGDAFFAPCVESDPETGACIIDFGAFHDVRAGVPDEGMHVQSHA